MQSRTPAAGAVIGSARSLNRITGLHARRALELETDRDEVVRWPRTRVLEVQLSLVTLADLVHLLVELVLLGAGDQESGVHDHLVADHLVRPRGDRRTLKLVVDLANVRVGLIREGLLDEPAKLHPREVRRRLLIRFDLGFETPELLVLLFDLPEDRLAVPVHFQAELELVLHLLENVAERVVRVLEELRGVLFGLEQRPEAHRHRREAVVDHDDLVHVLVGERVLTCRVVALERGAAYACREVAVVHSEDVIAAAADADLAEASRLAALDDAVHVDATRTLRLDGRRRRYRRLHQTSDAGTPSWRNSRVSS